MLLTKEFLCLLLCGWLIAGTYRRLMRRPFGRIWRVWFIILCCAGVALGFRLMGVRYLVSQPPESMEFRSSSRAEISLTVVGSTEEWGVICHFLFWSTSLLVSRSA